MAEATTNEQRGVGEANRSTGRPERPVSDRAIEDRRNGQTLEQEAPYATRPGPLMGMIAAVDRATRLEASRKREAELDALEKELRMREASINGGAGARLIHGLHQQKVQKGKHDGVGYGVEWLAKQAEEVKKAKGEAARDLFVQKKMKSLAERGLGMFSCLTMMGGPLAAYAGALRTEAETPNALATLQKATAKAVDARGTGKQEVFGGRGTVLLEELRTGLSFETVHIDAVRDKTKYKNPLDYTSDADVRRTGSVPTNPATQKVTGADTGQPIDVHVNVGRFIKLGKKMSAESRDLFEALKRVEFAVGVADSGQHTFALAGGMVYEVHWDKGPRDPTLTSAIPLERFFKAWGSGVIAVPPGMLQKKNEKAPAK